MFSCMPRRAEPSRESGRKLLIDQEIQLSYAKHDVVRSARCVLERGCNITRLQVGIVAEYFLAARAGSKEFEDIPHANSQAAKAGPASADLRIERHALQFAHFVRSRPRLGLAWRVIPVAFAV